MTPLSWHPIQLTHPILADALSPCGRGAAGDWKSYEDIVQWGSLAPDADETRGYYFNGPDLIARKVRQAREFGLGGVMIWEVGQDCRLRPVTHGSKTHPATCGEAPALLTAIQRGVAGDGGGGGGEPRDEL